MTPVDRPERPRSDPDEARARAADTAYDDGWNLPRKSRFGLARKDET